MAEIGGMDRLEKFFREMTVLCFNQLLISNEEVVDYLAHLLARFASTEELYKIKNASGDRLEYIIDFLTEANSALDLQSPHFSPFREREIRKHVGDYTLFMTGMFRDFVVSNSALVYYVDQGKSSYSSVSEFDRLAEKQDAPLYKDLSNRFEDYAFALDYMKKVYFKDPAVIGPFRAALRKLTDW